MIFVGHASPHGQSAFAPGHKAQLYAKHGEDKEHHKPAEPEGAHKLRYLAVGRVFRQQLAEQIATRTNVAAPPAASPDAEQRGDLQPSRNYLS